MNSLVLLVALTLTRKITAFDCASVSAVPRDVSVRYVNLEKRPDRRKEFEAQIPEYLEPLKKCRGWEWERAQAVDLTGLAGGRSHFAQAGCYLSHLVAIEKVPVGRPVLMFEDDFQFKVKPDHFHQSMQEFFLKFNGARLAGSDDEINGQVALLEGSRLYEPIDESLINAMKSGDVPGVESFIKERHNKAGGIPTEARSEAGGSSVQSAPDVKQPSRGKWDVLMLGHNVLSGTEETDVKGVYRLGGRSWTTSGYLVHPSFVPQFVNSLHMHLPALLSGSEAAIDTAWFDLQTDRKNSWYLFNNPRIGVQRPSFSDINNTFADYSVVQVATRGSLSKKSRQLQEALPAMGFVNSTAEVASLRGIPQVNFPRRHTFVPRGRGKLTLK